LPKHRNGFGPIRLAPDPARRQVGKDPHGIGAALVSRRLKARARRDNVARAIASIQMPVGKDQIALGIAGGGRSLDQRDALRGPADGRGRQLGRRDSSPSI
jgi:hypothetical protein